VARQLDGALAETVTGSITHDTPRKDLPKLQLVDLELPSPIDVNLEATGKVYTVAQLPRKLKNITMPT